MALNSTKFQGNGTFSNHIWATAKCSSQIDPELHFLKCSVGSDKTFGRFKNFKRLLRHPKSTFLISYTWGEELTGARQTKTNLERRLLRCRRYCVNTTQYTFVNVRLPCGSVQDCHHFTLESNMGGLIGDFHTWTVLLCSDTDDWFRNNRFAYFPWVALWA